MSLSWADQRQAEGRANPEEDGYLLLVSLDEYVLAPIALLTALCNDPVVRTLKPDEVFRRLLKSPENGIPDYWRCRLSMTEYD